MPDNENDSIRTIIETCFACGLSVSRFCLLPAKDDLYHDPNDEDYACVDCGATLKASRNIAASKPNRKPAIAKPNPFIDMDYSAIEERAIAHLLNANAPSINDAIQKTKLAELIDAAMLGRETPVDDKKLDQGKYMAGVLEDFLPVLKEIAELGSMNNKPFGKYERGSWMKVENAEQRYLDGWWRHVNEGRHNIDPESGKPHDVAIAWNSIVLVWFRLKREGKI